MRERKGEMTGWTGGWLGGFLWLFLLSILSFVHGRVVNGLAGSVLFLVAVVIIMCMSPWRHPDTKYWKLMLPIYAVFVISVGLFIWNSGGLDRLGLSWWSILWLLPVFLPFITMGSRCWNDGNA